MLECFFLVTSIREGQIIVHSHFCRSLEGLVSSMYVLLLTAEVWLSSEEDKDSESDAAQD